jgi:hypothetical protein
MRASGRLDDPSLVKPEMLDKGQPESFIAGAAGKGERPGQLGTSLEAATLKACDVRGNSSGPSPAQPKARNQGATQGFGRRLSTKGAGKGQPGDATRAEREDRERRATCRLIDRQNETMHDPLS